MEEVRTGRDSVGLISPIGIPGNFDAIRAHPTLSRKVLTFSKHGLTRFYFGENHPLQSAANRAMEFCDHPRGAGCHLGNPRQHFVISIRAGGYSDRLRGEFSVLVSHPLELDSLAEQPAIGRVEPPNTSH